MNWKLKILKIKLSLKTNKKDLAKEENGMRERERTKKAKDTETLIVFLTRELQARPANDHSLRWSKYTLPFDAPETAANTSQGF